MPKDDNMSMTYYNNLNFVLNNNIPQKSQTTIDKFLVKMSQ